MQSIPRCGPPRKIGLFLQARADLKPECYIPVWYCSTIHTFFIDCPFKGSTKLSKNIRMILRCAVDPMAGATAESSIPRGGGATSKDCIPQGGHTSGFDPAGGGGHNVEFTSYTFHLNDPAGGATSEDRIPPGGPHRRIRSSGGGPHRGICFEVEYLGEFEFIFERASGYESGGCGTSFDLKNHVQKIWCQCPFKVP